jgi:hypothetical protein
VQNGEANMNNLLNPDVIKAAASSPLGILSLMCLIIGVVSLGLFRKTLIRAKLIVFVLYSPDFADLGHRLCASRTRSRGGARIACVR